jgi:hypothetical protein
MSPLPGEYYPQQEPPHIENTDANEAAIQAAQTLFTTKLVDLTDKLTYIKQNMTVGKQANTEETDAPTAAAATLSRRPQHES